MRIFFFHVTQTLQNYGKNTWEEWNWTENNTNFSNFFSFFLGWSLYYILCYVPLWYLTQTIPRPLYSPDVASTHVFTCLKSNLPSSYAIMEPSLPSKRRRRAIWRSFRNPPTWDPSRHEKAAKLNESMHKGYSFMDKLCIRRYFNVGRI